MNDAEIAFQICMNDLFCFGERQFTARAHRPDDTSFEMERRGEMNSLCYSAGACWCEHFSSPSTFSQCDAACGSSLFHVDAGNTIVGVL